MNHGIVYCITNKLDGKRYVGITTKTLDERWRAHCVPYVETKSLLKKAIMKYGKDQFTIEKIDECDSAKSLYEREKHWISVLNCAVFKGGHGYNMTNGGDGTIGYRFSDEQKKRLSESRQGKVRGRKMSLEARQKMSLKRKGRKLTQEWKDAISRAHAGKSNSNETRTKMSAAKSHLKKPVDCIDPSGSILRFESIKDAERWLRSNGFPAANKTYIRNAARSSGKSYGYEWRFI